MVTSDVGHATRLYTHRRMRMSSSCINLNPEFLKEDTGGVGLGGRGKHQAAEVTYEFSGNWFFSLVTGDRDPG